MRQLLAVAILLAFTVGLMYLMLLGWNRRSNRIEIEPLPEIPTVLDPQGDRTTGVYVTSTLAGQPYERVVSQGLGVKSAAEVSVLSDGVLIKREGASDLFVPLGALKEVGRTAGMIGKFAAPGSIVVLRWVWGDTFLDTGVHVRSDTARKVLFDQLTTALHSQEEGKDL